MSSQRAPDMEPKPIPNRALALKLDPQILLLFTIIEPPQALQEATTTAPKRHPKMKSLFRYPFGAQGIQNRLQKGLHLGISLKIVGNAPCTPNVLQGCPRHTQIRQEWASGCPKSLFWYFSALYFKRFGKVLNIFVHKLTTPLRINCRDPSKSAELAKRTKTSRCGGVAPSVLNNKKEI